MLFLCGFLWCWWHSCFHQHLLWGCHISFIRSVLRLGEICSSWLWEVCSDWKASSRLAVRQIRSARHGCVVLYLEWWWHVRIVGVSSLAKTVCLLSSGFCMWHSSSQAEIGGLSYLCAWSWPWPWSIILKCLSGMMTIYDDHCGMLVTIVSSFNGNGIWGLSITSSLSHFHYLVLWMICLLFFFSLPHILGFMEAVFNKGQLLSLSHFLRSSIYHDIFFIYLILMWSNPLLMTGPLWMMVYLCDVCLYPCMFPHFDHMDILYIYICMQTSICVSVHVCLLSFIYVINSFIFFSLLKWMCWLFPVLVNTMNIPEKQSWKWNKFLYCPLLHIWLWSFHPNFMISSFNLCVHYYYYNEVVTDVINEQ